MMRELAVQTIAGICDRVASARHKNRSVGLVPTMGALHAGHVSLIRTARTETEFVVVSIFVNPLQFGPAEDFSRYPRPLDKDLEICSQEGVDVAFAPGAGEIYPPGFSTMVEVQGLQDGLCGASRPGHFRGVATVVLKLLNIVRPDVAFFGQKDFQQARIIERMVQDLDLPIRLRICPIIREPDGLALSSRNQYLDPNQRANATVLYRTLQEVRERIERGERNPQPLLEAMKSRIDSTAGAVLDYAAIVDADTLQPVQPLSKGRFLVTLAVKFGATRLIDNTLVTISH